MLDNEPRRTLAAMRFPGFATAWKSACCGARFWIVGANGARSTHRGAVSSGRANVRVMCLPLQCCRAPARSPPGRAGRSRRSAEMAASLSVFPSLEDAREDDVAVVGGPVGPADRSLGRMPQVTAAASSAGMIRIPRSDRCPFRCSARGCSGCCVRAHRSRAGVLVLTSGDSDTEREVEVVPTRRMPRSHSRCSSVNTTPNCESDSWKASGCSG